MSTEEFEPKVSRMPFSNAFLPAAGRAVAVAIAMVVVAGCSSGSGPDDLVTREPATPAVSPETAEEPPGTVVEPGTSIDSITFEDGTRTVAALAESGATLMLVDPTSVADAPRRVTLPEIGTSVTSGPSGSVLVTTNTGVLQVNARSGDITAIVVDGGAASAVPYRDGLAVGTPGGSVHIVDAAGEITTTIGGFASVDALSSTDDNLAVLDTRQTSLTSVDVDGEFLGAALRAGDGSTNLATAADGRIAVADTADDELLIFTDDDLIMRERFPVAGSPYGIAVDDDSALVWVTLTALNEVAGFDVSTGIPVEKARFATVRQPDSLAVDARTGVLFVGSKAGQGLQAIPTGT